MGPFKTDSYEPTRELNCMKSLSFNSNKMMTNSLIVEVIQIQYLLRGKSDSSITFLFYFFTLFLDTATQSYSTTEVLHSYFIFLIIF